jgi:menaquinone-specific isochorismate synthase
VTQSSPSATDPVSAATGGPLVVRSVTVEDPGDLLALLPDATATTWVRNGDGLVGWGAAAVLRTDGPDRFAEAREWWSEHSGTAVVRDEVDLPGSGLVCFGSFAFADEPGDSVLVVPEVVVGRRGGRAWVTTTSAAAISAPPAIGPADDPAPPSNVTFSDGAMSGAAWETVVA